MKNLKNTFRAYKVSPSLIIWGRFLLFISLLMNLLFVSFFMNQYHMIKNLQLHEKAIVINLSMQEIKKFEGFKSTPYNCAAGVKTIGYGNTTILKENPYLERINENQATKLLKTNVEEIYDAILMDSINNSKEHDDINKNSTKLQGDTLTIRQKVALISLTYNIGINQFKKSRLKQILTNNINRFNTISINKMNEIEKEFLKWSKVRVDDNYEISPGLLTRRKKEFTLFRNI